MSTAASDHDSNAAEVAAVLAAEAQRCHSIGARDREALAQVLSEDLMYRHSNGLVEGKEAYIVGNIDGSPRSIERPSAPDVQIIGEVAVVNGGYLIRFEPADAFPNGHLIDGIGLQVWRRTDGQWQLLAHHGSPRV
jgi:hypothetical protein